MYIVVHTCVVHFVITTSVDMGQFKFKLITMKGLNQLICKIGDNLAKRGLWYFIQYDIISLLPRFALNLTLGLL